MTTIPAVLTPTHARLRAARVLVRAAAELLAHALMHPFAPVVIDRRTGRVAPR